MVTTAREQDSQKLAESKSQFMLVAVLVIVYCLAICHLCQLSIILKPSPATFSKNSSDLETAAFPQPHPYHQHILMIMLQPANIHRRESLSKIIITILTVIFIIFIILCCMQRIYIGGRPCRILITDHQHRRLSIIKVIIIITTIIIIIESMITSSSSSSSSSS